MSTLVVDTIKDSGGAEKFTAVAWGNLSGAPSANPAVPELTSSAGIAGITDNGVGDYILSLINPLPVSSYSVTASTFHLAAAGVSLTATSFRVITSNNAGTYSDRNGVCFAVFA